MDGYLFIEFTTPPRCERQVISQKFSENPPLSTPPKKNKIKPCVYLCLCYTTRMTAIEKQIGNGAEIVSQGEWFIVTDTDLENGFVWAMDQDGGEKEISLDAIDDIRLEDIVTRDWSPMLNKLSL